MSRTFKPDDFPIALLLAIIRLADPDAPYLDPPPARMSAGTGRFDGGEWGEPEGD
jgi:hypothetical protein